jgi:hypothetical protein
VVVVVVGGHVGVLGVVYGTGYTWTECRSLTSLLVCKYMQHCLAWLGQYDSTRVCNQEQAFLQACLQLRMQVVRHRASCVYLHTLYEGCVSAHSSSLGCPPPKAYN